MVDRSAFDAIQHAGGYVSVNTGSAPEANEIPIAKDVANEAMNSAECIGCGACVATCKNASAMLFMSAKVSHLSVLPQGQPERNIRVQKMVKTMDEAGFGNCTNTGACEVECPKGIKITNISHMNADYIRSMVFSETTT
jgi:succinate dehydrogenase / fumarate reductase iron-sulfur subunit